MRPLREKFMKSIYDYKVDDSQKNPVSLSDYKGKTLLIVNVASRCGLTPQYKGLQELYLKYSNKDFEILAFPCNQFGAQEPGSNEEIKEFCEGYQISFPLFAEGPVRGSDKQEVFRFLTEQSGMDGEIRWNFEKFLLDRDGNLVRRYRSGQDPDEDPLLTQIETLL